MKQRLSSGAADCIAAYAINISQQLQADVSGASRESSTLGAASGIAVQRNTSWRLAPNAATYLIAQFSIEEESQSGFRPSIICARFKRVAWKAG